MSGWAAKRFWSDASVEAAGDGFEVRLDRRPVKTPAKAALILPSRAMAEAIAEEWKAQTDEIMPETMPVTRSANAAIDKVRPQHREVAELVSAYGDSDLLCYRAEEPPALVNRQAEAWDPLLEWAADTLGAQLAAVAGVVHIPQSREALLALRKPVDDMDAFALTSFHDLVSLSGSLVIGLAVTKRHLSPEELWRRSRIDESWQKEQWGHDDEASRTAEIRRQAFFHAERFFRMAQIRD